MKLPPFFNLRKMFKVLFRNERQYMPVSDFVIYAKHSLGVIHN